MKDEERKKGIRTRIWEFKTSRFISRGLWGSWKCQRTGSAYKWHTRSDERNPREIKKVVINIPPFGEGQTLKAMIDWNDCLPTKEMQADFERFKELKTTEEKEAFKKEMQDKYNKLPEAQKEAYKKHLKLG